MSPRNWKFLLVLIFLLSSLGGGCRSREGGSQKSSSPSIGPFVGSEAPDFHLQTLNGREAALTEYRGRVVLINFWATWCIPCRAEMPQMETLYRDFRAKGLEILAVSIDLPGESSIGTFVERLKLSFPILLDEGLETDEAYEVRVVPTSLLIDRRGIVAHRFLGAKDWNDNESRRLVGQLVSEGRSS